ncbi:MAG: hypothetical protein AB6733_18570 [Clostridiaceae bacterium]
MTEEAIAHVNNRLKIYGLSAEDVKVADTENLPYNGSIKVVIYNRHLLNSFYLYLKHGLFKGKPFLSFSNAIYHHMESIGTKAFTISELKSILSQYPVEIKSIQANATYYDLLKDHSAPVRFLAYILACICGFEKCGWFLTFELKKI